MDDGWRALLAGVAALGALISLVLIFVQHDKVGPTLTLVAMVLVGGSQVWALRRTPKQ
ncbi:MAG: hypothetical protein JWM76_2289 [Pseudonocardiales bacterium]|nr:hypothetical protein [Pseudonocardiales bacterium]